MSKEPASRMAETAAQPRKGDIPLEEAAITLSWGERLLPYLYIAMESCVVYALLSIVGVTNVLRTPEALLPLWSIFILFAGSYAFSHSIERFQYRRALVRSGGSQTQTEVSGSTLLFGVIALLTLLAIWGSEYANRFMLIDPGWLGTFFSDILLLNPAAFRIFAISILAFYFCWRALRFSRRTLEPGSVLRMLRIGIVLIIIASLLHPAAVTLPGTLTRLLLIPLFLALSLLTHSLARAVFMRQAYPVGLRGGMGAQERSLALLIGAVGLCLFIFALLMGSVISPDVLKDVQQALSPLAQLYNAFAAFLAQAMVILVTPVVWLLELLHFQIPKTRPLNRPDVKTDFPVGKSAPPPDIVLLFTAVLKVVLPLLVIALFAWAIFSLIRRSRQVSLRRNAREIHESLWSWSLFRQQFSAFLLALWRRFFGKKVVAPSATDLASLPVPAERSIRGIYRAFLRWAAQHGYARQRDETAVEFQQRLERHFPATVSELQLLTAAYMAARYGEVAVEDAEQSRIEQSWLTLQRATPTQA